MTFVKDLCQDVVTEKRLEISCDIDIIYLVFFIVTCSKQQQQQKQTRKFQLNKSYLFTFCTFFSFFSFLYYREQHRMHYKKCTTLFSSEKGNLSKRSHMDQPKAIEFNREAFSGINKP